MYLGRKLKSFHAEDSGIVAAGARKIQPVEEIVAELVPSVELKATAASVPAAAEAAETVTVEERDRLRGLVGLLRKVNGRLRRDNRRLTKENEALRDGAPVTVDSILSAGATARQDELTH